MLEVANASELNIKRDIALLSSAEFGGRLSGTAFAEKTALNLADSLKGLGYAPAGENGFLTPVNVVAARLVGPARLKVGERQLKHRIDFSEWNPHASGGSVTSKLITIRDGENVDPESLKGSVVLIPERPEGFDIRGTVEHAEELGVSALLIESGEPKWFNKTIFSSGKNNIPVIRLRKSLVEQFASERDLIVELSLPLESKALPCNNVLGLLKSHATDRTLLLTAHYDHLGDDPDGLRFPGAIDNASGVAVMLEVARKLIERRDLLPFNVLFAFLTGEESGLRGARQLASQPPLPLSAVINLDCLGFEPDLNALRTGHKQPGHWLTDIASQVIERNGIDVRWIAGGEDSAAFTEKGIPALGLGQKPTLPESISIHTPVDHADNINMKPVIHGLNVVLQVIEKLAVRENWD